MSYTIGFVRKNERDVWATETPTAHQAVAMIATLQESTEEIRFISSPQEGEMGIEMLLLLAKEEAEELPRDADAKGRSAGSEDEAALSIGLQIAAVDHAKERDDGDERSARDHAGVEPGAGPIGITPGGDGERIQVTWRATERGRQV